MTLKLRLRLLVRVVQRRVTAGEDLDAVLAEYPRLTEAEKALVLQTVCGTQRN